ncbi:Chaperone protein DnaJ [Triticum urartu]|uniref:Chaperone protein DnaJ n=1 Tax=Triticum urartu TaxID=4572 RepID=M8A1T7_TRIUA|nr:Chaperone protein DnaJ [Triticum urartu]
MTWTPWLCLATPSFFISRSTAPHTTAGLASPQAVGKRKDHYEILGVPKAATAGDINEAYHKRSALKWKEAERGVQRLTTAHKVLSDPLRRPLYDKHLRAEEKLMGKAPPPAASTGVALERVVRTGRKGAALGREVAVAGTGGRQNADRTGGGAKRAGLRSSTGKASGNGKRSRCLTDGATDATGAHASTTSFSTGRSTFEMSVKYTNEYYNEENCSSFDGEPFCPIDHSTFKTAVKYTNEYYTEEKCSSFDGEPFCPTDHSTFMTAVKYANEYYTEENCSSFDGEPFCPTDHSTFKAAVKTMNEYYDEDENLGLCVYEEEGVQDDYGNHAGVGNDDTRVCDDLINGDDVEGGMPYAKYDDCGGGDHNYGDHGGAGNNDDTGVCDDYYDNAAGGFDNGYYDGDAGNGADDWW